MTSLERLQTLQLEIPRPGTLQRMLMDGDDSEWERALKSAAPDLIAVAVAAAKFVNPLVGRLSGPMSEHRLRTALAPLLESEGEE